VSSEVTGTMQGKYLTVDELSEYLQVHRTTIYRMLKERRLPGFRIGSYWRFNLETIKQWQLDQMKIDA
jgi:excisionase family DNA binding protein